MTRSLISLFALVMLTMVAFAANSLLARLALADSAIDAGSYTFLRLVSGAIVLIFLATRLSARKIKKVLSEGNWVSALALFTYAAGFSFAYLALDTGMGALILFAMVQATMIGWALANGDRPIPLEWIGLVIAFGSFIWLVSPGLAAPDPFGTLLMVVSGAAWGIYSVRGRSAANPLAATAGNFVLSVPAATLLLVFTLSNASANPLGIVLAIISGAITSGLGYALWYRVLPQISSTQGAIVQLTVPVIAAAAGVAFIGEELTFKFGAASLLILGGVALAITAKARRS
ncbi:MAG: DMT family transporter [Pseudomonadota bacterium]